MDKSYRLGQNRYKPNGYFIYKMEDAIVNKAKSFSYIIPSPGKIILFCSKVGGSELAKFMSYEKDIDQVGLQFIDDKTSFKFNVSGEEVFMEWGETTGEDSLVIDYYSNKELLFIKAVLESTQENLKQLKTVKENYLKNIEDPSLLVEIIASIKNIQVMANDLISLTDNTAETNLEERIN